jgi:hypothetical protein
VCTGNCGNYSEDQHNYSPGPDYLLKVRACVRVHVCVRVVLRAHVCESCVSDGGDQPHGMSCLGVVEV